MRHCGAIYDEHTASDGDRRREERGGRLRMIRWAVFRPGGPDASRGSPNPAWYQRQRRDTGSMCAALSSASGPTALGLEALRAQLRRSCARILDDSADIDDVVQEALIGYWQQPRPSADAALPVLLRSVRNRALNRRRALQRQWRREDAFATARSAAAEASHQRQADAALVKAVLARLPIDAKAILEARYLQGCSQHDLSQQWQQSPDQVRRREHRALQRARQIAACYSTQPMAPLAPQRVETATIRGPARRPSPARQMLDWRQAAGFQASAQIVGDHPVLGPRQPRPLTDLDLCPEAGSALGWSVPFPFCPAGVELVLDFTLRQLRGPSYFHIYGVPLAEPEPVEVIYQQPVIRRPPLADRRRLHLTLVPVTGAEAGPLWYIAFHYDGEATAHRGLYRRQQASLQFFTIDAQLQIHAAELNLLSLEELPALP